MTDCENCFKIVCRGCGWEPNATELLLVQSGKLMTCPLCGWQPARPAL